MKPVLANAAANLPTRHAREAGANLLNRFQYLWLPSNRGRPPAIATHALFLFLQPVNPCRTPIPRKFAMCETRPGSRVATQRLRLVNTILQGNP
jgi:hypothetical protein